MGSKAGPSAWLLAVERAVRAIPRGKTASYGQVALMAGKPGAARAVVRALHALKQVPWWRVLRSDGSLAEVVRAEQGRRLRAEGVAVRDGRVPAAARLGAVSLTASAALASAQPRRVER